MLEDVAVSVARISLRKDIGKNFAEARIAREKTGEEILLSGEKRIRSIIKIITGNIINKNCLGG